jgi:hypothetical protein
MAKNNWFFQGKTNIGGQVNRFFTAESQTVCEETVSRGIPAVCLSDCQSPVKLFFISPDFAYSFYKRGAMCKKHFIPLAKVV